MSPYPPLVRCSDPHNDSPRNCHQILRSMPITKARQIFGHRDDAGVEVGLPYTLENGKPCPCYKYHNFLTQIL